MQSQAATGQGTGLRCPAWLAVGNSHHLGRFVVLPQACAGACLGAGLFGLGDYPWIIAALCSPESPSAPGPAPGRPPQLTAFPQPPHSTAARGFGPRLAAHHRAGGGHTTHMPWGPASGTGTGLCREPPRGAGATACGETEAEQGPGRKPRGLGGPAWDGTTFASLGLPEDPAVPSPGASQSPGNDKERSRPLIFESACVGSKATQKLWLGFGAVRG